jgi:hypothetical protein
MSDTRAAGPGAGVRGPAVPLFRSGSTGYRPTTSAVGPWHPGRLHGGAVAALAAARATAVLGPKRPLGRITVDFLGPVPAEDLDTSVRPLRDGRSFAAVTVSLTAGGTPVARATAVGVRTADTALPPRLPRQPPVPPREEGWPLGDPSDTPSFNRDATETVIVDDPANPFGGTAWTRLRSPVTEGGAVSGPAAAVALADLTHGIGALLPPDLYRWTNLDLTVHLLRPPRGEWIALRARTLPGGLGRGIAESTLLDPDGAFGTAAQTLLITKE